MKTEKETIAEIALDVRKATREKAEAEYIEAKAMRRELEKEERKMLRELEVARKEKRSTFYYAVAMLFLTSSGIGGLTSFLTDMDKSINWYSTLGGFILTIFFAIKANNELKKMKIWTHIVYL